MCVNIRKADNAIYEYSPSPDAEHVQPWVHWWVVHQESFGNELVGIGIHLFVHRYRPVWSDVSSNLNQENRNSIVGLTKNSER